MTEAALHEAGHALIAYLFKRGPVKMELYQNEAGRWEGVTFSRSGLDPEEIDVNSKAGLAEVRECVLVSVSGITAELLSYGRAAGRKRLRIR